MTFKIDTRNVANHKQVCYKKKTKDGYPYADATYYLAWGSMAIGIGEITKKNYTEVYSRHKFVQQICSLSRPFNLTLRDVYAHIGLKTNVGNTPMRKWFSKKFKQQEQLDIKEFKKCQKIN